MSTRPDCRLLSFGDQTPSLHGVSNHRQLECLLSNSFWWHQRKHWSWSLLVLCGGKSPWPVDSPHKRPVMRKVFTCHDVIKFVQIGRQDLPRSRSTSRVTSRDFWSEDKWWAFAMHMVDICVTFYNEFRVTCVCVVPGLGNACTHNGLVFTMILYTFIWARLKVKERGFACQIPHDWWWWNVRRSSIRLNCWTHPYWELVA